MSSVPASASERPGFRDPALSPQKRVDDLLSRLTPDERITMLHQYVPAVPRLGLAAFRPVVASGAATGAMAAYNLVNGRPCHVSPLIEAELRRWAEPTGHELFVVSRCF